MLTTLTFLSHTIAISMSGVLAPGPVTAATLAAGVRNRHAGFLIAVGHGIVEFPLMGLLALGAAGVLQNAALSAVVGLVGSAVLLAMAAMLLAGLRRPVQKTSAADPAKLRASRPILTGVLLTAGNPYFLVWWAAVGLLLVTRAQKLGLLALVLFALVHWLCDAAWLEFLSLAGNKGTAVFGVKSQRCIAIVCAGVMAVFGVWFLVSAAGKLV